MRAISMRCPLLPCCEWASLNAFSCRLIGLLTLSPLSVNSMQPTVHFHALIVLADARSSVV
jgi:hypothetical protein